MKKNLGFTMVEVVVAICVVGIIGAVGYVAWHPHRVAEQPTTRLVVQQYTATPSASVSPTPIPTPGANWKTYSSSYYQYSFLYPPEWTVEESAGDFPVVTVLVKNRTVLTIGSLGGRGCGEGMGDASAAAQEAFNQSVKDNTKPVTLRIGNQSVTISNFCGENYYQLDVTTGNRKSLSLYLAGAMDFDHGRIDPTIEPDYDVLLRSLKGITLVKAQ